jgi:transcription-repair coupling factor (superfamily II helicase)
MLENAVRALKQMPPNTPLEVNVDLPWPAFLPKDYVSDQNSRIEVYRRLSRVRDHATLGDFRQELRDRYGPIPPATEWMLVTTAVKIDAERWQIASIHRNAMNLVFSYRDLVKAQRLSALSQGRMKIIDEKDIYLRLQPHELSPEAMHQLMRQLLGAASG